MCDYQADCVRPDSHVIGMKKQLNKTLHYRQLVTYTKFCM